MAAKKSNSEVVTFTVRATLDVKFKSYGNKALDDKAREQILIWVEEVLNEEDQIPLFVSTQAGEETLSKVIKVKEDV
jgi:cobalamin biosynthesis protein CbiD